MERKPTHRSPLFREVASINNKKEYPAKGTAQEREKKDPANERRTTSTNTAGRQCTAFNEPGCDRLSQIRASPE